ncbi:MAG: hypothetical protein NT069_01460 [Planctomycetota bacterium]|nr:hypothetical protein [Planctomycetota bacterium]
MLVDLQRAAARLAMFENGADFEAFERGLVEAMVAQPTRLFV